MLGPEKDLERKLREAVMAVQLEHRYSKRTILERYLNTIYFGNGAYGVQAAAATATSAATSRDLDLAAGRAPRGADPVAGDLQPVRGPGPRARPGATRCSTASASWAGSPAAEVARGPRPQPLGLAPEATDSRYPAPYFVQQVSKFVLGNKAFGATKRPAPAHAARRRACASTRRSTRRCRPWPSRPRPGWSRHPRRIPRPRWSRSSPTTGHVKAYVGGSDYWGTAAVGAGRPRRRRLLRGRPGLPAGGQHLQAVRARGRARCRRAADPHATTRPASLPSRSRAGRSPGSSTTTTATARAAMNLTEATVSSVNTVYAQLVMDARRAGGRGPRHEDGRPLAARRRSRPPRSAATARPSLDMAAAYGTLAGDGIHTDPVFVTRGHGQ